ncbi:aminopeptidase P N-terminal domain-containing protein [Adhaeribacter radiodurans]|uniref:Xaa-Pro aminopeptidase n=1 Tax=Adhaeribacter radiodurans TaxID=2745197 RepID=A0A7L7L387_9BACT|nr:aminopeptidase P N-terminal domain-containing protein [Adhaeribacter radiodurans]QMU27266.1 aminopeptidase P N-terminal domain-containing protein [Adhaeribacter radiodurans]
MAAIRLFLLLVGISFATRSFAQNEGNPEKPSDFLDKDFHRQRRELLIKQLPANSVAVFFANPERNRANDVDYTYHQDPDFYYLTGYREPNSVLILFAQEQSIAGKPTQEVIFIQPRNPKQEQWNGKRLGEKGVAEQLGLQSILLNSAFATFNLNASAFTGGILIKDMLDAISDNPRDSADLFSLVQQFKQKVNYPGNAKVNTTIIPIILDRMREIKTPEELNLLRKAIAISAVGQQEVMKAMQPNMSEAEIQGLHEFVYKKYGSEYEGYPSIVGAGNNACVLHYIENDKPQVGTNLVLMDVGAEYHGYTADVTRTIPANGKFTLEQKQLYQLVFEAQQAAFEQCKAGNPFNAPHQAAKRIIAQGLKKLGIIKKEADVTAYFPHGTSHYLGLDVHDRGAYGNLQANSVITVEPGIYIPEGSPCSKKWWGIGIRIEDDILISEREWENLSVAAPRSISEIEALMAQPSALDDFVLPELK